MSNRPIRRSSRAMALCGLMTALAVIFLLLGGVIPLATFACPLLAMICMIPAVCEYGPRLALVQYAAAAALGLLLSADKELALVYLSLGYYPAVKPAFDRITRRLPRVAAKCSLFLVAISAMYWTILHLFRLEAVVSEFAEYTPVPLAALLLLGSFTFLCFDRVLEGMTSVYRSRVRGKLFH